ncbi:FAD-binding oxidoreductase [Roseateles sp.]|uniref:FAD-binding oxidoreductase n=1 Tax=Roseateles sp. TaxID=1971397 RepID=UPI003265522A
MHSISTSSGRNFEARPDEPILEAALRQGIVFDYSCRTGRCSTCKGKVLSGETAATHDELGLTADERAQGFVLTCIRQARGPVAIEIDDLGEVVLPQSKTVPCRIQAVERLTRDVMRVQLRLPPTSDFEFLPGQYIEVIGSEGVRRSYSVANAPRPDKHIELYIREVPNGAMSRYWFQHAKVNDLLRLRGPLGTFFVRAQAGKDLVLLATGTGIAPVKAILEGLDKLPVDAQPRNTTVYWGARHRDDLYIEKMVVSPFRLVPVLSRADDEWVGARGHVQDVMLADGPDLPNTLVYACGSDAMIHSAQVQLQAAGLPRRQFHSDAFVCSSET